MLRRRTEGDPAGNMRRGPARWIAGSASRSAGCDGPTTKGSTQLSQEIGKPPAERPVSATEIGIRELLEAGVHFGHQTRRWNPKMRRFIFGERGGIHIIDLQQTERLLKQAQDFAAEVASRGGTVLFVGTKKQARDAVKEAAEKGGMPYVNQRWLGGLLTNFQTINRRIRRLHQLTDWTQDGTLELLPTRERIGAISEREKLEMNLGGVRDMQRTPDAVFIVDLKTEAI